MGKSRKKRKNLILELFNNPLYTPMGRKSLNAFMQVEDSERDEFDSILDEMIEEGLISETKNGSLKLTEKGRKLFKEGKGKLAKQDEIQSLKGIFTGNQNGYGFVTVEGFDDDFFIPEGNTLNACDKDTVEIIPVKDKKKGARTVAKIVKIAERSKDPIVGRFTMRKNYGFVVCDNNHFGHDVYIDKKNSKGAVEGSKVIVEIIDYGDDNKNPEGKVTQVIGHEDDPGVDILSIALAYGIESEFPAKALNQAERANKPLIPGDLDGREDFRNELTITIDGEDSKDLDDAISLVMDGTDYILGVHIADVSNYVQEGSAVDREALKRGTSVYLADRVIPMLPHALSNGICSLNEGEDRLTLSCIMRVNEKGKVTDSKICESVINSNHRMTYSDVKKIITDRDEELTEKYSDIAPMLYDMLSLSKILEKERHKRGAIDFDFPETKLVLDENGKPIDIKPYDRNDATRLIESFMLLANETVAEYYHWAEIPFLYRVHEKPDAEKIEKLCAFIRNFGYSLKTNKEEIHPKEFQKLLSKIDGTTEDAIISRLTLRSMSQAKYSPDCTGHFGLACKYYCHFTSPIRRYPDLQIHRIIKDDLRHRMTEEKKAHYAGILPAVALSASKNERRADEAERETVKLKKAEYMLDHLNEIYEGVISGVTAYGMYVELENTCEGLVHISTLNGFYEFKEKEYALVAKKKDPVYRLGEKVKIMVKSVDISLKTVDFILADFEEGSPVHDFYKKGRNTF